MARRSVSWFLNMAFNASDTVLNEKYEKALLENDMKEVYEINIRLETSEKLREAFNNILEEWTSNKNEGGEEDPPPWGTIS